MEIFARQKELKTLEKLYYSTGPEFLAIWGRRRIGKTFLIRQFFKNKGIYFELTGIKDGSYKQQLQNFSIEFFRVFKSMRKPKSWPDAFNELRIAIENTKEERKIILFFDEVPWLATPKSGFLQALDYFWNRYLSDDPRIILVVCGSAASWMIRKILQDKGGLHGRLTARIRLLPFNLKETELFLSHRGIVLERKQLIDIYMAIGGVAKYLSYIEKGQSSLQAIHQICFEGPLFKEFDELYASLFDNYALHIQIVKALAEVKNGLTATEISQHTKISSGGGLTLIIQELEESGLIASLPSFGKHHIQQRFRLIDEYSLFYLKWISQAKSIDLTGIDEDFWLKAGNSPAGLAWAGYAFESLCMRHIRNIKEALRIGAVSTAESEWVYKATPKSSETGAQIDLIIDRADHCVNLCEIKYTNKELSLDKDLAENLRTKKNLFIEKTHCRKSLFLTLISTYGVKKSSPYLDCIDVELTMDDLFR